jgi:hypothetical protein
MVKIDVEGAEAKVLEGMTYILHGDWPKLLVEVHRPHASAVADMAIPGAVLSLHEKGEDEPFSNASEGWDGKVNGSGQERRGLTYSRNQTGIYHRKSWLRVEIRLKGLRQH